MSEPTAIAAIALGGNLGDPVAAFAFALARLDAGRSRVRSASSVYRTAPWGLTNQPDFLNMAALVATSSTPREALDLCLAIEAACGRVRTERWGPRTLDLDLIDYGGRRIEEPGLQLPHPRAAQRAFVLIPLAEIAPDLELEKHSVRDRARSADLSGVAPDEAATARLAALWRPRS